MMTNQEMKMFSVLVIACERLMEKANVKRLLINEDEAEDHLRKGSDLRMQKYDNEEDILASPVWRISMKDSTNAPTKSRKFEGL